MPYKRVGKKIYKESGGKWKLKQTAKNVANAISALRLLRGLHKGTINKKDVGKKGVTKKKK